MPSTAIYRTGLAEKLPVAAAAIVACGFELGFLYVSLYGDTTETAWTDALFLHTMASVLMGLVFPKLLPAHLYNDDVRVKLFIFVTMLFMPLLGMAGFILAVLPGLYRKKDKIHSINIKLNKIRKLPPVALEMTFNAAELNMDISASLKSRNPEVRLKALIATLKLQNKNAIPLLIAALKDPEDEIRLLAYSILEKKEQAISNRIQRYLTLLENATRPPGGLFYKQLANEYWEFVHHGLVQGEAVKIMLEKAYHYNIQGLQQRPDDPGMHFQTARILIRMDRFDEAEAELNYAQKLGIDRDKILPYLAEISFARQQFQYAKQYIREIRATALRTNLPIALDFWGNR